MKSLVLAEKPSVGRELARVLDCNQKKRGYVEGKKYIVSWALGHLVTLAEPGDYDQKYRQWVLSDLPLIPEKMKLKVIKDSSYQFKIVQEIMLRDDVSELIIATDAGREGELVARWILIKGGWRAKPVKRLWISSQTDAAIKEGFSQLKSGWEYDNLFKAAVCRAEADWLIGLNVTRALTCKFDIRLNAGRVQTPTLSILISRENEIKNFTPRNYWQLKADFGEYYGTWQDKNGNSRIYELTKAEALKSKIQAGKGKIKSVVVKPKIAHPPAAYDLTELQRDANRRYGFSAKHTLDMAQRLYERHKLITYPRTDSRYITNDMIKTLLLRVQRIYIHPYRDLVVQLLKNPLNTGKHFVNNSRVTDHHAIIPTEEPVKLDKLTTDENKVYDLIVRRFICVLYPDSVYNSIVIETEIEKEIFISRGKKVTEPGWKILGKIQSDDVDPDEEEQPLKLMKKGVEVKIGDTILSKFQTNPPSHFTEATLLTAMEKPGKFIDDPKLKDSIKAGGLGTPATRAEIIEKLIRAYYVERQGRSLIPTDKAFLLMDLVPEELKSPELTAEWELRLSKIARGKENDNSFMAEIKLNADKLIASIKKDTRKAVVQSSTGVKCPKCGNPMLKLSQKNVCLNRHCAYEQETGKPKKGLGRKSKKDKQEERYLVKRYGKQKRREGQETLGDLFDF